MADYKNYFRGCTTIAQVLYKLTQTFANHLSIDNKCELLDEAEHRIMVLNGKWNE